MPEASVIRGLQALSGFTGHKGSCRLSTKFLLKDQGSTLKVAKILVE